LSLLPEGCEPSCHACQHRALAHGESAARKQAYLAQTLAPWADRLAPLAPAPAALGYRERATLNARWDADAGWRFGLVRHRDRRDEFIAIPRCPVHAPRLNAALAALARALPSQPELPLAFVVASGAQLTLIVKARRAESDAASGWVATIAPALAALGYEGLWLHLHPAAGRRLFARSGWTLLWGTARSRDASGAWHGPTAFAQLQPALHAQALDAIDAHLAPDHAATLVDLYCGIGKGLARATARGTAALGVELSGEAVDCARANATAATVLRGTCGQRLPQVDAWLAAHPGRRLLAVNPPRSGLEPEVRDWIARRTPARASYLSCSAGSLARDLAELERTGLRVTALRPFDFFPQTHHVEVLALLAAAARPTGRAV
jgi:tRNA/tmRNA/rRNA uracil-C5-methylase (TrmA/RlmC/RlmD family)